jgi:hypothetical protein
VCLGLFVVASAVLLVTVRVRVHDDQPPDPTSLGEDDAAYGMAHAVPLTMSGIVDFCIEAATQADQTYQQSMTSYGDSVDDGCVSTLLADRHP